MSISGPSLRGFPILDTPPPNPAPYHSPLLPLSPPFPPLPSLSPLFLPPPFIGAMIDITDSKLAEEKLRATEKELTRVTRLTAAGQMAASISHEIKQPLAAIVAGASAGLRWLSRPKPDLAEVRAGLEAIVSDGNRASDVIDGIRAIFKNDSREKISLDVSEVIREVLALMQFELHNHRILVHTELTSGLEPVFADRINSNRLSPTSSQTRSKPCNSQKHALGRCG